MIVYAWPKFRLEFNPDSGEAFTRYPDGAWSGCGVVEGDRFHAARLGVTPATHRLLHELAHHVVGLCVYGADTGSPVIWRDAHHLPQEAGGLVKDDWSEADREEWFVTALTYLTLDRDPPDWGAVGEMAGTGSKVGRLVDIIRYMLDARDSHLETLTISRE